MLYHRGAIPGGQRLQTKDWKLWLPPQATIEERESAGGLTWMLSKPDDQTPYTFCEQGGDGRALAGDGGVRVPRSNAKVKVGPFYVWALFSKSGRSPSR